tara:strand:- start:4589 stop:5248 length:660 start_codon:yes stop_codon:yes gene_type:complete
MENSFYADLVKALGEIKNPELDGQANYGKYATINSCLKAVKTVLQNNNLSIMQLTHTEPDRLVTRIIHTSGAFIEDGGVPLHAANKNNPQQLMGCLTYAKRNGLCACLGISGDQDDDGQSATPQSELPEPKSKPQPQQKAKAVDEQLAQDVQTPGTNQTQILWINDQIKGFEKHKHMGVHLQWAVENQETLQLLRLQNKELYDDLMKNWQQTKRILNNE